MKRVKRIIAILSLIVIVFAVSYFVYTAKQIPSKSAITEAVYVVATTI